MIKAPLTAANHNGYGALNGIAVEDRTGLVCAVAIGDVPELDAEAMARLIAAAPDLLAALKATLEELRLIRMKDCGAVYDPTCRILAQVAIDKAEGLSAAQTDGAMK